MDYSYNIANYKTPYHVGDLKFKPIVTKNDNIIKENLYDKDDIGNEVIRMVIFSSIVAIIYTIIMLIALNGATYLENIKNTLFPDTYAYAEEVYEETIIIPDTPVEETEIIVTEETPVETNVVTGTIETETPIVETPPVEPIAPMEATTTENIDTSVPITPGEEFIEPVMIGDPLLYKLVQAEAGNQDIYGKECVASVVLNRIASEAFPNTVEAVAYEKISGHYQFQVAANGELKKAIPDAETITAVNTILNTGVCTDATYFKSTKVGRNWHDSHLNKLFTHGGHTFYKV